MLERLRMWLKQRDEKGRTFEVSDRADRQPPLDAWPLILRLEKVPEILAARKAADGRTSREQNPSESI